jgi:cell division protein FtsI/penicillin-binding protein 2
LIAHTGGQAAFNERFSPGSLAKIPLVWHLMAEGRLEAGYAWRCTGRFFPHGYGSGRDELIHEDVADPIAGQFYKCSLQKGHGLMTLVEALAVSCNHTFLSLHDRLTPTSWRSFCEQSGLTDSRALASLSPYPSSGLLDPPACQRDRFLLPLGFGLRVTPAGLAVFFTSLLSDGMVRTLVSAEGREAATLLRKIKLPPAARMTILQGMRAAVRRGTAKNLATPSISLIAKTGSGLVDGEIFRLHGWCVAALPADKPRYLFVSFMRESYGGGPPLEAIRHVLRQLQPEGLD